MNRTIKGAAVKSHHDDSHAQMATHLQDSTDACYDARCIKILNGSTLREYIREC